MASPCGVSVLHWTVVGLERSGRLTGEHTLVVMAAQTPGYTMTSVINIETYK